MKSPRFINEIRKRLLEGETLTTPTEILAGRGWRLAAAIHYLRKKYEWRIESNLDSRGVAHYRLSEGWPPKSSRPANTGKG